MLSEYQKTAITLQAYKYASAAPAAAKFLSKAGQKIFWMNRAKDVGAAAVVGTPLYGMQKLKENRMRKKLEQQTTLPKEAGLDSTGVTLAVRAAMLSKKVYPFVRGLVKNPAFYAGMSVPVGGYELTQAVKKRKRPAKKASFDPSQHPCY